MTEEEYQEKLLQIERIFRLASWRAEARNAPEELRTAQVERDRAIARITAEYKASQEAEGKGKKKGKKKGNGSPSTLI